MISSFRNQLLTRQKLSGRKYYFQMDMMDPNLAVDIKEEPQDLEEPIFYSEPPVHNYQHIEKTRSKRRRKLSKNCSLCSENYNDNIQCKFTSAGIHSLCSILGICSSNSCFEEIFKSFSLCTLCTGSQSEKKVNFL